MKKWLLLFLICSLPSTAQEKVEIFFDFNKYDLNESAVKTINDLIATGKDLQVAKIYGFCDWKGTNSYNDTLSLKRVASVHDYLISKGVRIRKDYEQRGFGEDFTQSEVQAENRKVIIVFSIEEPVPVTGKVKKSLAEHIKTARPGDKIKLENIHFHNNSATVVAKSRPVLYDLLCVMEENPNLKIEIQGHICCQKLNDINDVSTARARAVYNFLIRNKVNRKRLSFKGFGVSQPIHPIPEKNEDEANENRRVEIMIVEN